MEDGKVSVARDGAIKVRMGEGASMKRGSIGGGKLGSFSLQRNTIPSGMIPDEFCNFFLSIFIDKDKGVMARIVGVVFMPSFPGMDDVFVITDMDMQWRTKSLKECFWFLFAPGVIWVNEVSEGGDVGEVCNAIVFLVCDGERNGSIVLSHCLDEGFKVFCDYIDVVIHRQVGCFVADDGFAKRDGVVNLGLGRVYCLKDRDPNSFNLGRGRREVREVFLDLTGCGVGFLLVNIPF